jgi:hydroxymethylpyrimidine pyrophosphatase-like HAD family hydrolase
MNPETRLSSLPGERVPSELARGIQGACKPLPTMLLKAEADFYRQYTWCLNAFPTIQEVIHNLSKELSKLGQVREDWHFLEVLTNIFLLSCTIIDTLDDYLLGQAYDLSKPAAAFPYLRAGIRVVEALLGASRDLRTGWLTRTRKWRERWKLLTDEFLLRSLAAEEPDGALLSQVADRMAALLSLGFPGEWLNQRPRIPAFFRSRDFTHFDCLELGRKLIAAYSQPERPVIVVGLRTAGSFLAPLLCAYLRRQGYRDSDWVTLRPRKGVSSFEQAKLHQGLQKGALAVIVDEPVHTANTLVKTVDVLRRVGFADKDTVALVPVEPALPSWRNTYEFQSLCHIGAVCLEPEERHKQRLLDSDAVEVRLREYLRAYGYENVEISPSAMTRELNREWSLPAGKVDVRLKRVYEVHLQRRSGEIEVRYVLAKSVGWGWLGYHAFLAGDRLAQFVPPVLGLRDGILYTEWIPQTDPCMRPGLDRNRLVDRLACYVAARAQTLRLASDPSPDLAREGRHKGFELLANVLSRAYGSRIAAALKRLQIRQILSQEGCPLPTMTDGQMAREEWVQADSRLLKTDFEHHCQGKNEADVTDPAFDLASAMVHFGLSQEESTQLIRRYVEVGGDATVERRLFVNKLLAGAWSQMAAVSGLYNARLSDQREKFHRQYVAAWNFLITETVRECSRLCQRQNEIRWNSPLVVLDIDGVLDRMVFGFPSTTASGIQAISLLHAHGLAISLNTARTLREVKEYCRVYGFVGGVAEYGSVAWDAMDNRTLVLVSEESLRQLEQARSALKRVPGVFLNDDYEFSLRAFTYQGNLTAPLPRLLAQNLMAALGADQLSVHHTGLDTAIVAKEIDKGAGLLALLNLVGKPETKTLAIGDSESDLPMFHVASRCFAPAQISCGRVARLLGCQIADRPYQPGLLRIVRSIVHPDGVSCDRCRIVEAAWPKTRDLFANLLDVADQKPTRLLLQTLLERPGLSVFRG